MIKKFVLLFWPIIFVFFVWFIFSFPYILKGRVAYPSTYQVNFFPPWSSYPKFWGPVKNGAMPDVIDQIYPWKHFTIEMLKKGQIPFWNAYSFSGTPHLANFQSAVLSPFNLIFFVLPFIDAWSILILLQPLLAGLFTYLFIRAIRVSRAGSIVASIAFMFSGFIVVWMAYGTLAYAILYLPLALFAIEKYYQKKRIWFLLLLMLTIPLSFFSGHFQISIYFFLATVAYTLFKSATTKNFSAGVGLALAIVFGLFISLFQIIPSIEFYLSSVRSELFMTSETIPFQYLITIIAPDFFGNAVTRNDWFGHYAEWASFVGITPVILAIFAFTKKNAKVLFFAFLAVFSLILSVQSPLIPFIISLKIPVISTSAQSRIIVLFSFSLAVLAGFGFDRLIENIKKIKTIRESKRIIISFALMGIFFALIWLLLFFGKVYPQEWLIVAKRNLVLPTVLFAGGVITIFAAMKQKKFLLVASCYLLVATSFDSLRFAQKWMPYDPKELVFADVPITAGIRENIGYGRIFGNFGAHVDTYYGFPSIEGYDPLYIGRYGEFIRSASTGSYTEGARSVVLLDRRGKYTDRVIDLLGVSLIFHPIADTNQGWAYPVWSDEKRFSIVFQDEKFQLFKNKTAMDRVTLFYNFEVIKQKKDIIKRFYSDNFDFRKTLILEENPDLRLNKEGTGSAQIILYAPSKVVIKTHVDSSSLLFISDSFYPAWRAIVNGKKAKIFRADYSFRAVVVPEGESIVEFVFDSVI